MTVRLLKSVISCLKVFRLVLLATALTVSGASGQTHVSGTLTTSTTWTVANSPYILDTHLTVGAGVVLTIDPGVVVKVTGQTTQFVVQGSLVALGTTGSRIVFTSIQDDSVAGDSGLDGPTAGAPGQWYHLRSAPGSSVSLRYADVRYSGWGSSNHGYAGLNVQGTASIESCNFSYNQRGGLLASSGSTVVVIRSIFSQNANGISAFNADIRIESSLLSTNSDTGLFLNYLSTYTGAPATITDSEIFNNTLYGVLLQVYSQVPAANVPVGARNNIFNNGGGADQRQLYSWYLLTQSSWTDNYWGTVVGAILCPWAPPTTQQIQLVYEVPLGGYCSNPGKGPTSNTVYLQPNGCPNFKPAKCAADKIKNHPYATNPFNNGGW